MQKNIKLPKSDDLDNLSDAELYKIYQQTVKPVETVKPQLSSQDDDLDNLSDAELYRIYQQKTQKKEKSVPPKQDNSWGWWGDNLARGVRDVADTAAEYSGYNYAVEPYVTKAYGYVTGQPNLPSGREQAKKDLKAYQNKYKDDLGAEFVRALPSMFVPLGTVAKGVKAIPYLKKLATGLKSASKSKVLNNGLTNNFLTNNPITRTAAKGVVHLSKPALAGAASAFTTSEGYDDPWYEQLAIGAAGGVIGDTLVRGVKNIPAVARAGLKFIKNDKAENDIEKIAINIYENFVKENVSLPQKKSQYVYHLKDYLRKIRQSPDLYSDDFIQTSKKNLQDLQKTGFPAELNDVFEGVYAPESMAGRGSKSDMVRLKITKNDKDRNDATGKIIDKLTGDNPKPLEYIGHEVRNQIENAVKEKNQAVYKSTAPKYENARFYSETEMQPAVKNNISDYKMRKMIGASQIGDDGQIRVSRPNSAPVPETPYKTITGDDWDILQNDKFLQKYIQKAQDLPDKVNHPDVMNLRKKQYGEAPNNAVSTLLTARQLLNDSYPETLHTGTREQILNSVQRLSEILKKHDPKIADADLEIMAKAARTQSDNMNKYGQIINKKEVNLNNIVPNLMSKDTTLNQFKNVIKTVTPDIRRDMLASYLKKMHTELRDEDNLDLLYNRAFKDKTTKNKMALLSGGRNSEHFKQIEMAMGAVKNLKFSKAQNIGSNTHNKALAERQTEMMGAGSSFFKALSRGNVGDSVAALLQGLGKVNLLSKNKQLQMDKIDQEAFHEFFINPNNTEQVIDFIAQLKNVTKPEQARNLFMKFRKPSKNLPKLLNAMKRHQTISRIGGNVYQNNYDNQE